MSSPVSLLFCRQEYQGIEPPVNRSEDNFDPGSKYHIIASVPYIRSVKTKGSTGEAWVK